MNIYFTEYNWYLVMSEARSVIPVFLGRKQLVSGRLEATTRLVMISSFQLCFVVCDRDEEEEDISVSQFMNN